MEKEKIRSTGKYLFFIAAGLLLGWLFFGGGDEGAQDHQETSLVVASEYTCSMHPQVRQDEPGDCPICGMELIPVSEEGDEQEDDPFIFAMQDRYSTWANVRTTRVEAMHSGASIRLTGKVAVNEREQRLVAAHFPGRIEALFADYTGRFVQRGERLATMYSPELMAAQQELIMASNTREDQPRLYESARNRLELFNLTESQIAGIEARGQATPTMDVYATQSGFLTERAVSEGDYVNTGQTLFTIAGLSTVWVELDAYESQISLIQTGQQAEVMVGAEPGSSYTGNVEFVDPFLNPRTRSARVRLTVSNRNNRLKPGMLVTASLTGDQNGQAILVIPETAVLWTGKRSVVYVKQAREQGFSFEFREIETGARMEEGYQVLTGLTEGEEVAVNGVFAIDAAAQLGGQFSMMAPPERISIPEAFKIELETLFNRYFDLKNALADDEPQTAARQAAQVLEQLEQIGEHALEGEHHMFWMEQYGEIRESLGSLMESEELDSQRVHFEPLSAAMIRTARTLGAIGQTWYVAYCPMVDGDRGAYWLSEFEQIINPYFGSMMLRCGEVRETIREGVGAGQMEEPREQAGHVH